MTKNKILLVFFALVFCFRLFADDYADCTAFKRSILNQCDNISGRVTSIQISASDISAAAGSDQYSILARASSIAQSASYISEFTGEIRGRVNSIICSSNDTCAVDLLPLSSLVSNIYEVLLLDSISIETISDNCDLLRLVLDDINNRFTSVSYTSYYENYVNVRDHAAISAISNLVDNLNFNHTSLTNQLALYFYSSDQHDTIIDDYIGRMYTSLRNLELSIRSLLIDVSLIFDTINQYLPYLETINSSVAYLATNEYFNVNVSNLSNYLVASSSAFRGSTYYNKPSSGDPVVGGLTSPYNNAPLFNRAVFADSVRGGFMNLISCLASVNNYLYWIYERFPTNNNDLAEISVGLASISNTLNRVDSYVLGDFSNQFYNVYSLLDSFVSNQLNSAAGLSALIETNNIYTASNTFHLASIDSKLDVLDYIKILSDTPLSAYSGDGDYFDYLTNLYINGSSSAPPSTNWFERMEILLASLVFGDSDGTNDIPQSVEMEGVDSSAVESALSDYTYNQEFTGAINALDDTSQSFIGVLNGLHTSIKSVSLPASISIGLGGLDGEDTHNFEDMMHGHFQVSFNTGIADRFTIAVRAVTTISWILLFFLALWKSGFYLIRKLVYFYRLVTRLLVSVFTR